MDTLKVLHIMSGYGGGISSFISNKANEMNKYNIQFDVITYDECPQSFVQKIESTGGQIYKMFNPKKLGWKIFSKNFIEPFRKNEYDVVHCHITGIRVLPYYILAKRYSNAKFLIHAHSSYVMDKLSVRENTQLNINQRINRMSSDLPLGCGELAIHSHYGKSISKNNMMVIPNSIDVSRFINNDQQEYLNKREQYRKKYNISTNEKVIGHIGRLTNIKNHNLTISLGSYIKEHNLNMRILIVGEGYRETELKSMVDQKDLKEVITFTGRISPIEDFFPALDVMILPSFAEGLPTVVVEAQASGVPVVMSNTITEEVDLGFGMLEAVSLEADIAKWVEAIQKTQTVNIPDSKLREQVIKEKKFSNETSAKLYVEFLRGNISQYTII